MVHHVHSFVDLKQMKLICLAVWFIVDSKKLGMYDVMTERCAGGP